MITILVMGHLTTAFGNKANTEKFDMSVVIVNQCSTINHTTNDDDSELATIVLIAGAMLNPSCRIRSDRQTTSADNWIDEDVLNPA